MAVGYGHSHVHEKKPRKKVWNRVASSGDRQAIRDRLMQAVHEETDAFMDKAMTQGVAPQHHELTVQEVNVALPGSPGYVCVHGVDLGKKCTKCTGQTRKETSHGRR
jgi:hypothetical protein